MKLKSKFLGKRYKGESSGFTIIELMISMTVLAVILLLIATTSIQIGRLFYKGVSSSRTQEAARSLSSTLSRSLLTNEPSQEVSGDSGVFCIGSTRYTFNTIDKHIDAQNSSHFYADTSSFCSVPSTYTGGKELLPSGIRLFKFELKKVNGDNKLWNIDTGLALGKGVPPGEGDIFERSPPATGAIVGCVPATQGGQFCDVSELNTTVYRRFK